jgi:putative inorganic carbon (hco3(-)) transporter
VAELIVRLRGAPRGQRGDLAWVIGVGGAAALLLGALLTVSVQAACALVLVLLVVALYQHDRQWGIAGLLALWFLAPLVRRLLGLMTGPVANDPLSLAPFLATGALAALALVQYRLPTKVRVILLLGAAGFAVGLPLGFLSGPRAAVYAFVAYVTAVSAGVLGFTEGLSPRPSILRRVLLFGLPPLAAYAIAQRYLPLTPWDQNWVDVTDFYSLGSGRDDKVRVFGTLNSPGTFAALLALSLLCYLTVVQHRLLAIAGATVVAVALSLTFVRAAWYALVIAALAHVVASRGQSARLVLGTMAVTVAAALALSPVSAAARDVVNRFETITNLGADRSANDRSGTFSQLLPDAVNAPQGHGIGTAGESTKLDGNTELRYSDNGYLSLMYQAGPLGFLLVVAALALILFSAWNGARARAPGQDLRLLLFAMVVYFIVLLPTGDAFYGSTGVILWFIAGQVLAYEVRPRNASP